MKIRGRRYKATNRITGEQLDATEMCDEDGVKHYWIFLEETLYTVSDIQQMIGDLQAVLDKE